MWQFLRQFTLEPVSLSLKEKCIAALASFSAILGTGLLTQLYAGEYTTLLVASMGASAVILFVIPGSPLAQPWPFLGGQLLSAIIGVYCAFYIPQPILAAALAVGLAIWIMLVLRCLHPPGAATALAPIVSNAHHSGPDLGFLIGPVGINVLFMLLLAIFINRLILRRDYPARLSPPKRSTPQQADTDKLTGISLNDIQQVTQGYDHFIDIGADELLQIYRRLQLLRFEQTTGALSCGDIMQDNIVTAEYATEVEDAWTLMHKQRLTVLPVLDRARRVIGIVTRHDFLKNIQLTPYRGFQDKWQTFIKSTPHSHTDKPEALGHIMTRRVKTLPATAHISELLPLIVNEGHHHIPITDAEGRFAGIVFQSRLISALFTNQLPQQTKPALKNA
ncbi:HPP family protein [Methylomonas methanica]|uniref:CBS domain containing membrane protein n=1 Tax=Methylomonas methanica (strain DSM 25384 / MC09) TaxID=857087 RepID=G0A4H5_METMM|nr:HPP family protein [Methylomonas methanica]AEG01566.1 CBS domain containing membrane protein [Methylomonas methanica MC09]